jgi:hypothetical protein
VGKSPGQQVGAAASQPIARDVDARARHVGSPGASACIATVTRALGLDWRTRHRTVRAEHATIAGFWPQPRAAARAFVEEQARVGRHEFDLLHTAVRTRNRGLTDHRGNSRRPFFTASIFG